MRGIFTRKIVGVYLFLFLNCLIGRLNGQVLLTPGALKGFDEAKVIQHLRSKNVPEKSLPVYLNEAKWHYMDSLYPPYQANKNAASPNPPPINPLSNCINMGFEDGSFSGWQGAWGVVPARGVCCPNIGINPIYHQLQSAAAGNDKCSGISKVLPGTKYSAQIGKDTLGVKGFANSYWGISELKQTWTVQQEDSFYTYFYQVVMQNPITHSVQDQPYFEIIMFDQNGDTIPCSYYYVSSGSEPQNFLTSATCSGNDPVFYKPWTAAFIPLQTYVGQQVTIRFRVADCNQGGHYGYAYVDASCSVPDLIPNDTICDGGTATFTVPINSPGVSYTWSTGATTQSITTSQAGKYSVKVTLSNGCSKYINTELVKYPKPIPSYTYTIGCTPTVNVSSTSTISSGTITYDWNWGDNTAHSSDSSASHTYAVAGVNYKISLVTTSDKGCIDSIVQTVNPLPLPKAAFIANNVCFNNLNCFTDQSTITAGGIISSWRWDFGDNKDTLLQNPCHKYNTVGTYPVKLVVTSNSGCKDSVTKNVTVHPLPLADFNWDQVCFGDSTHFTDNSSITPPPAKIVAWTWNFGNNPNNISNLQHPAHWYSMDGSFPVILTVTSDSSCQSTINKSIIVNPLPVAGFTAGNVCLGTPVQFTDTSSVTGVGNSVRDSLWNFGDSPPGNTSTSSNPSHIYTAPGTYTVSLVATTNFGCLDTASSTVIVHPNPVPAFTADTVCQGVATQFNNQSVISNGSITSYSWSFPLPGTSTDMNPTYIYPGAGVYTVTLTTTSNFNCTTTKTGEVLVHPNPKASFIGSQECEGTATDFTDQSTVATGTISGWKWNFGDATPGTASIANPTYTYHPFGIYNVWLVVTSDKGCKDSIQKPVNVNPIPVVGFGTPLKGCTPVCVSFEDTSKVVAPDFIAQWLWDLGDSPTVTSTERAPFHCYTNPGVYNATLSVITNNGCPGKYSLDSVAVVYAPPVADFIANPSTVSVLNSKVEFIDQSTGNPVTWHWDFGLDDADTANTQHTMFTYPSEINDFMTYDVTLTIVNEYGCPSTVIKPVNVSPEWTFFVPNTFTPNGDGVNDSFFGTGIGIVDKEMWIYDRWGNEIFHTHDLNGGWDGKVQEGASGEVAQIDTYVWIIRIKEVFGNYHRYIGHVNIIK